MCEKLWKWKNFMHFLTLFYISVLTSVSADYAIVISVSASVSADMKIRYIGGYRYRPIWKNAYRSPTTLAPSRNTLDQIWIIAWYLSKVQLDHTQNIFQFQNIHTASPVKNKTSKPHTLFECTSLRGHAVDTFDFTFFHFSPMKIDFQNKRNFFWHQWGNSIHSFI